MMDDNETISTTHQIVSVSGIVTGENLSGDMMSQNDTNTITGLPPISSTFNSSDFSETSTEVSTFIATTGKQSVVPPSVPAVIIFAMIILLLAVVIFGIRSKRRKRRPIRKEEKIPEDETPMAEVVCNEESIYLDVMPSTKLEAEDDDAVVERETPYVTLEFDGPKENGEIQSESVPPVESAASDPSSLLESQETRL